MGPKGPEILVSRYFEKQKGKVKRGRETMWAKLERERKKEKERWGREGEQKRERE